MADKTLRVWDNNTRTEIDLLLHDNGDGTYSIASHVAGVTVNASDLQIGAIEIKNATDDTRAVVKSDGTNNALVVTQNTTKGAGAVGATTPRMTLASDDPAVASLALMIPAAKCDAVTPDDGNDLPHNTRALMVSVAGDVKVDFVTTGTEIVLTGLQPGIAYPFQIKRVYATSTTATGILALY